MRRLANGKVAAANYLQFFLIQQGFFDGRHAVLLYSETPAMNALHASTALRAHSIHHYTHNMAGHPLHDLFGGD